MDDVGPYAPHGFGEIGFTMMTLPNSSGNFFAEVASNSEPAHALRANAGTRRTQRDSARILQGNLTDFRVELVQIRVDGALLHWKEVQIPSEAVQLPNPASRVDAVEHRNEENAHAVLGAYPQPRSVASFA